MDVTWGFVWSLVFTGLFVVALALVVLIFIINIMGFIFQKVDEIKNKPKKEKEPQITPEIPQETENLIVADGITDEEVAAISAALAVIMSESGKAYTLKSIKRAKGTRSAWSMAGISQNTSPF